jgi:hypothetical protein
MRRKHEFGKFIGKKLEKNINFKSRYIQNRTKINFTWLERSKLI